MNQNAALPVAPVAIPCPPRQSAATGYLTVVGHCLPRPALSAVLLALAAVVPGLARIDSDRAFLDVHSDHYAAAAWRAEYIEDRAVPPLTFTVGGRSSDTLAWTKTVGKPATFTDYPDDQPVKRTVYTITYAAAEVGLQVAMEVTSYPGYPVVEFEARLKNIGRGNSAEIRDVRSLAAPILKNAGTVKLHYSTGSNAEQKGAAEYVVGVESMTAAAGSKRSFELVNGKSTSTWLPNFNAAVPAEQRGVIAVLSWQGNWRSDFEMTKASEFALRAGQHETRFVLLAEEEYRAPLMVLLYYRGDYADGQNVWRRWFREHNIMRAQGIRMETNVLVGVDGVAEYMTSAAGDKAALAHLQASDLRPYVDFFNQDAGWYELAPGRPHWTGTGNWYADPVRYPNGLREVTDAVRAMGLKYALWLEPERIYSGTKTFRDLKGMILAVDLPAKRPIPRDHAADNAAANLIPYDEIPLGTQCLVNYAFPEAVDYTIEVFDALFTKEGVDQFRQDFNTYPAPFWAAYDRHVSTTMGIPRYGLTEEKYCTGYLRLWSELVRRRPGMMIDACASGSMRADLATMRHSFIHTRTDYYVDTDMAQNHTYSYAMWYVLGGTGLPTYSNYEIRSRLTTGVGIGVNPGGKSDLNAAAAALKRWKEQAAYVAHDYYPLTAQDQDITAVQFNSPGEGKGMAVVYFRKGGATTVFLRGLVPDATYVYSSPDLPGKAFTATGAELMKHRGIAAGRDGREALMFVYQRQE